MHLFKAPPIDAAKDLQIAAGVNKQPFMVMVPASSPYKTLAELTAAMKQKGDKASYAQSNTSGKVMGELYKQATGIKAVEVPYRTANDSLNDFASGRLDYGMMDPVFALSQARAGRLRMLAVSTPQRMQAVPELPTMAEAGVPGVELLAWFAAMVPSATPRPIIDKLNQWFNRCSPPRRPRSSSTASAAIPSSPRRRKARRCSGRASRTGRATSGPPRSSRSDGRRLCRHAIRRLATSDR